MRKNYMRVRVKLFGVFRLERFKQEDRDYPLGTTVQAVVDELRISEVLLGIILINGTHGSIDTVLQDDDCLCLLPLLGGG